MVMGKKLANATVFLSIWWILLINFVSVGNKIIGSDSPFYIQMNPPEIDEVHFLVYQTLDRESHY